MLQKLCILLIRFYQIALSPFIGKCCRFYPSCSEYGKEAIEKYGVLKGLWKCLKRLGRCHPFSHGGIDYP